MIKNKINKILYTFIFPVLLVMSADIPAFGHDLVKSYEIEPVAVERKAELNGDSVDQMNNFLDADNNYKGGIDPNKPEFEIKNPLDYIKEKRAAKKAAPASADKDEQPGIQIFCKEMEYFEDTGELEARENIEILTQSGAKAVADKALYNKGNNTIKLLGNVVLTRGESVVEGDYMLIDLNEENALMDEPVTKMDSLVINAEEGYAYSDRIENLNGNIELNRMLETELHSSGFTRYGRAINDKRLVDFDLKKQRSKPYSFKTKEVVIYPERDHDIMLFKNADIYYKNKKILNVPSMEFFSDKELTYNEVNLPIDFGSLSGYGMYLGLGHIFKLPKTYTFRFMPSIVYGDDELGIGAIAQLRSNRINLEAGWASSTNNLIVDGQLKITDRLKFDIGRHAYKSEWFNGGMRAGYIGELSYDDRYLVKDLGNAIFRHRISAGYVADYKRVHQEDDMEDGFRYRYQAELTKSLKKLGSNEQDMFLDFSVFTQTMATVYSQTGDTVGLVRAGPKIESQVKHWNSIIAYGIGGIHGKSPYRFDEYRYGRQSIMFDESLILNRFISLGYRGILTPLKDNSMGKALTENCVYVIAGPEDMKIAFSYDAIRHNMHFDYLFLLGSDNIDLKYEKLTIMDPDKLGKTQRMPSDKELYKVKIPEDL